MATRYQFCERVLRHVFGEQPADDSNITVNLVNQYLNDAIGLAVKQNWKESVQLDGVSYINNSFYTTFKNIPIVTDDEQFIYKFALPQIPLALGRNEGIGSVQFVDASGNVSDPAIPISENQWGYFRNMRPIPNKMLYLPESNFCYVVTTIQLFTYTAKIRIVSGGDSTDINSLLNVPDDLIGIMITYCSKMLMEERAQPKIAANMGEDIK